MSGNNTATTVHKKPTEKSLSIIKVRNLNPTLFLFLLHLLLET